MTETATWPVTPSAMSPVPYRVRGKVAENRDSVTLHLGPMRESLPAPQPGEFMMMYAFGVGEIAVSVSGVPTVGDETLSHTIRSVGAVSRALHDAQPGSVIGMRGPFGTGWGLADAAGRDLVIVAGGVGLAPLRPVVVDALADRDRYGRVTVIAGARSRDDFLFDAELQDWARHGSIDVHLTVDVPVQGWPGEVGFVTEPLPSLHNSQPWRWIFENGTLQLFADHARIGRHTDSTGREVILSCGAVLNHLEVAAAAGGWRASVERYPDPHDHDHLASIVFHRSASVGEHERVLGEAISQGCTDRLAFAEPEPWVALKNQLRTVLRDTATDLDVIDDNGRPALADASRRTEEHRHDDASYRYELLWWTGHSSSADGVPSSTLASHAEASHVDVARDFPAYGSGDRRPQLDRDHSKILVLSTYDDSRENTLRCGEALSRVLLECTAAGLATCTLTHMMELHSSREIVRRLTGRHAEPQVLVRVGRAPESSPPPARTPRRPLHDVLNIR